MDTTRAWGSLETPDNDEDNLMGYKVTYRKFMRHDDNAYVSVIHDDDEHYMDVEFSIHDGRDTAEFSLSCFHRMTRERLEEEVAEFLAKMEAIKFAANAAMDDADHILNSFQTSGDEVQE